ncbi:SRPBCC family protein [Mycobacterium colombiense]
MRYSIRFERACAAPPEVVYGLLIDVERWPDWLPGARSANWEETGSLGAHEGAIRRIVVSGLTMREEVLVDDGPHHHAYRIVSGVPVTDHRADVHIEEQVRGSLIVWRATFRSRIPFAGPLIWLMLRASMPRMATALARGAEHRPA